MDGWREGGSVAVNGGRRESLCHELCVGQSALKAKFIKACLDAWRADEEDEEGRGEGVEEEEGCKERAAQRMEGCGRDGYKT